MAVTAISGLRGTGEFNTDFRPTNYRELYTFLEPNGTAPFNALLAMGSSESTDDPKYNNFRDEMPARVLKINNAAGYDAVTTSLTVDASTEIEFVTTNTIIVNARTGEVMRATADATGTTIVVSRNIGGTASTILDNDDLFMAGYAAQEGANVGTPISFDPVVAFNYTQIFRTPFSVTNTTKETSFRIGDREDDYAMKALKLHMQDVERAMFWGRRAEENGTTAQPRRYTGGLFTTLTNVTDVNTFMTPGQMTEDEFDRLLIETIFAFGSKQKVAFIGAKVAGHLQAFGKNRWQPSQVSGTYGVSMTRYSTFAGDLVVHLHPQFRQVPGMDEAMVILDFPQLRYRYLQNRDTKLLRDRQSPGEDLATHEYLTECGLELLQDKVHAIVKNWGTIA